MDLLLPVDDQALLVWKDICHLAVKPDLSAVFLNLPAHITHHIYQDIRSDMGLILFCQRISSGAPYFTNCSRTYLPLPALSCTMC